MARVFLDTSPQDRSGEDRTLVVVHVSAEQLSRNVPAGTPRPTAADPEPAQQHSSVPAGTPDVAVCQIEGVGSVEAATGQRLVCDNPLLGAIVDTHGTVLALGALVGW